jgi:hypothetical protein
MVSDSDEFRKQHRTLYHGHVAFVHVHETICGKKTVPTILALLSASAHYLG